MGDCCCERIAPSEESSAFLDWEVADPTGELVVCPACITPAERQVMDEDSMDLADDVDPD